MSFINELTGQWAWLIYVSIIASLAFIVVTVSQFVKILLTKNTTSLTLFYAIILPLTNTLICVYDIALFFTQVTPTGEVKSWSLLIPAIFNGLISAYATMFIKIKHVRQAKKLKLTEIQYYEKYLKPKSYLSKKKNKK